MSIGVQYYCCIRRQNNNKKISDCKKRFTILWNERLLVSITGHQKYETSDVIKDNTFQRDDGASRNLVPTSSVGDHLDHEFYESGWSSSDLLTCQILTPLALFFLLGLFWIYCSQTFKVFHRRVQTSDKVKTRDYFIIPTFILILYYYYYIIRYFYKKTTQRVYLYCLYNSPCNNLSKKKKKK